MSRLVIVSNRSFSHPELAPLYCVSWVGPVTPLRDGMTLVVKEYVVTQARVPPGVLALSRFTGTGSALWPISSAEVAADVQRRLVRRARTGGPHLRGRVTAGAAFNISIHHPGP